MTEYKSIIFELTYPTDNFPTNTFTRKPWLSLTDDQFSLYSELIKKYQPSFDNTLTLNEQIPYSFTCNLQAGKIPDCYCEVYTMGETPNYYMGLVWYGIFDDSGEGLSSVHGIVKVHNMTDDLIILKKKLNFKAVRYNPYGNKEIPVPDDGIKIYPFSNFEFFYEIY